MLRSKVFDVIEAIERDLGELSTRSSWCDIQHIANSAIAKVRQSEDGKRMYLSVEERLLNMRNAMLMELTNKGTTDDSDLWRVKVAPHVVEALYIGLGTKPNIVVRYLSELPQWMQERVMVLSMLTESPPTKPIEGVGRRISQEVFWIVK